MIWQPLCIDNTESRYGDEPKASGTLPKQQIHKLEQSREREQQSMQSAQTGAPEVSESRKNTLQRTHYPPARIHKRSAAGFLIRAALTPFVHDSRISYLVPAAGQTTSFSSSGLSCLIS
jgi:hypothetical protein